MRTAGFPGTTREASEAKAESLETSEAPGLAVSRGGHRLKPEIILCNNSKTPLKRGAFFICSKRISSYDEGADNSCIRKKVIKVSLRAKRSNLAFYRLGINSAISRFITI